MLTILHALLSSDITVLSQPGMLWGIVTILFSVIFLESAFLPAAFLPGDSLLLLAGVLVKQNILPFYPTLFILVGATGSGYWLNYILGRWLGNTQLVTRWLSGAPEHYHTRAKKLFERYGLPALLVGRFLGFVRTLLPLMAGLSHARLLPFQAFSWAGAFVWILALMSLGGSLTHVAFFKQNQAAGMALLLGLPLIFLVAGVFASLMLVYRRRKHAAEK